MNLRILAAVALVTTTAAAAAEPLQPQMPDPPATAVSDASVAPANATEAAPQAESQDAAPAPETPVVPCCKLAALTPVEFEILTPASSKTSHQGEQIRIRVIEAVRVDGRIVIPAGTEGYAEVIQASRGAFGGKAGELVMGAPFLMLGNQRIDLKRFRYGPVGGRDNTGTAMIVALAAGGIFGIMVGGGNIDIQSGARANAVVTRDTFVPVQPQVSSKE